MYRKYIEDLKKWLNNPRRKPLMIWGARQTGKSYLVEELFAKQFFANKFIEPYGYLSWRDFNYFSTLRF